MKALLALTVMGSVHILCKPLRGGGVIRTMISLITKEGAGRAETCKSLLRNMRMLRYCLQEDLTSVRAYHGGWAAPRWSRAFTLVIGNLTPTCRNPHFLWWPLPQNNGQAPINRNNGPNNLFGQETCTPLVNMLLAPSTLVGERRQNLPQFFCSNNMILRIVLWSFHPGQILLSFMALVK